MPGILIAIAVLLRLPKAKRRFTGANLDVAKPEETLIVASGENILIAGRDRSDPKVTVAKKKAIQFAMRDIEGIQTEYGTVNAVKAGYDSVCSMTENVALLGKVRASRMAD